MTKALVHKRGTRRINEMAFRCGPTGEPVLSGESLTRITGLSKGDRPILSSPRGEEDKKGEASLSFGTFGNKSPKFGPMLSFERL